MLSWLSVARRRAAVLVSAVLVAFPVSADPGFGGLTKKKIGVERRQPAMIRLTNVAFYVVADSGNPMYQLAEKSLVAIAEAELLQNDRTLRIERQNYDWRVLLTITNLSVVDPNRMQRGNQAWYGYSGSMNVAYRVLDKRGKQHDAGNIASRLEGELPESTSGFNLKSLPGVPKKQKAQKVPRTRDDVQQMVIEDVVRQIAAKLGNTSESLEVYLAKDGRMETANRFMEKKLWSKAQEELEAMSPYGSPEQDAYRLYNLGIVHEALAYSSSDFKTGKVHFFKAQEYYDKAQQSKTEEKYFFEPLPRIKDGIARYRQLENMDREDEIKGLKGSRAAAPAAPAPPRVAQPVAVVESRPEAKPPLALDKVVEMVRGQVPASDIVFVIESASKVEYDPANPDHLLKLNAVKPPIEVVNALRKKAGLPPAGARPAAAKKPAPAAKPATAPKPAAAKSATK
ncbi:MAG: hypothetical protein ACKV22_08405 [Bryobacteraceae bacterium]